MKNLRRCPLKFAAGLFGAVVLCCISSPAATMRPTLVGAHAARDAQLVEPLGVKVARIIIIDQYIDVNVDLNDESYTNSAVWKFRDELAALRDVGVKEVIITLRWPTEYLPAPAHFDRVPSDQAAAAEKLEYLLVNFDPYIDWLQLNNEPLGGPGSYIGNSDLGATIPEQINSGFDWLDAVAVKAKQIIATNNLSIKLMSPGITGYEPGMTGNTDALLGHQRIVDLANQCSALDLHLNVDSLERLQQYVEYVKTNFTVNVPFTAMEWSDSKSPEAEAFVAANQEQLNTIYSGDRMTTNEWVAFTESYQPDEHFIPDSLAYLQQEGFLHACYAGIQQFSSPDGLNALDLQFGMTALYTTRTTLPITYNQPFHQLLKEAANRYNEAVETGLGISETGTEAVLTVKTWPAVRYQIRQSTDLQNWSDLGEPFIEHQPEYVTNFPPTLPHQFFRIIADDGIDPN